VTTTTQPLDKPDFELVFNAMPGMCLVLDPALTILAQNDEHARMTLSADRKVVGQKLFDAFPDSPSHNTGESVSLVRQSLLRVLKTRARDAMPVIRYDVKTGDGPYEVRWWSIVNVPILDQEGAVRWIINRAEDVTELVKLRQTAERR
jgi:PAS domain-containing protein